MQHIFSDNQNSTPKSEVLFLPIIDPSDETCIIVHIFNLGLY